MDETASCFDTVYVSAGRRGLQVELRPADLIARHRRGDGPDRDDPHARRRGAHPRQALTPGRG